MWAAHISHKLEFTHHAGAVTMSRDNPMTLQMKQDEQQVKELRLVAAVLDEQVAAVTTLGKMLNAAADRVEWLSACVDGFQARVTPPTQEAPK